MAFSVSCPGPANFSMGSVMECSEVAVTAVDGRYSHPLPGDA